jgi:hypothetical protein
LELPLLELLLLLRLLFRLLWAPTIAVKQPLGDLEVARMMPFEVEVEVDNEDEVGDGGGDDSDEGSSKWKT